MASEENVISDEKKNELLKNWKKAYAKVLVETLAPTGDYLQIGCFSGGCDLHKAAKLKSHTVIASSSKEGRDKKEAKEGEGVCKVLEGSWESELPKLGKFDTILYFNYTPDDDTTTLNYLFTDKIIDEVEKSKELFKELGTEMAQITVQYTMEDLEEFYNKIGQHHKQELTQFFKNLLNNKNITKELYNQSIKKFNLENIEPKAEERAPRRQDPILDCLEECLNRHMPIGGRFAFFSNHVISRYEDAQFFERIITNSNTDYQEKLLPIEVDGKKYDALLVIVEKKG